MFSMTKTRLDIVFINLIVGYFAKNLNYQYTKVLKTILQYLKDFKTQKINTKVRTN